MGRKRVMYFRQKRPGKNRVNVPEIPRPRRLSYDASQCMRREPIQYNRKLALVEMVARGEIG